ncbi:GTP cyclohydrolase I domain protein [Leptospira interrogans serovar Icterohaemorrhagiae str. Verdun HP]|uniref:GTP cyclohydrolase I n=1 Tax=Leptospira interrogans serovar Icterohaemorrhagiae str. Verdun HP TaxID=1049910 RepID=M6RC00_LEPIR|nr:GTP cyclohydrolase I domain protein [Leptospira interrogans serovar Icterohaemorrhagiae str. Verdun HP]
MTSGYRADITKIVNGAIFEEPTEGMVLVRDIEMYSLCEHHLLPFYGKAHVAYLSNKKIIGISKIPRIVDVFCQKVASSRTSHRTDCLRYSRSFRSSRCCRGNQGKTSLYDDERGGKTKF